MSAMRFQRLPLPSSTARRRVDISWIGGFAIGSAQYRLRTPEPARSSRLAIGAVLARAPRDILAAPVKVSFNPQQAHLVPGFRLDDRYELLYPYAQGGMATVWVARLQGKHGFEKLVAVKTLLP